MKTNDVLFCFGVCLFFLFFFCLFVFFFFFFWSPTTVLVHLYFHYESPSIIFSPCDFLANFLTNGLFLTSTTQTLPNFNGENCSFDVFCFIFGCMLLAEFQWGIDLCMIDGYNFSRITLTFFIATSTLNSKLQF